jgi:hypothetical protein
MLSSLQLHMIGFRFAHTQNSELVPLLPSAKSRPTDGKRLTSDFAYLRKLHLAIDPRGTLRRQMVLNDIWQLTCDVWEGEHLQDEHARLADSEDELMNRAAL